MTLLIKLPEKDVIQAGDMVEDFGRPASRYKVRQGGEVLVIKYRGGKYWFDARYGPGEMEMDLLYQHWQKVHYSPAVEFLREFERRCRAKTDYWNHSTRQMALYLAIDANMEFWIDDMEALLRRPDGNRVTDRRFSDSEERIYSHILSKKKAERNKTALKSLEKAMNRKPFILDGDRIYVGKTFRWKGLWVKCTSIKRELVWSNTINCKKRDVCLVACEQERVQDKHGRWETKTKRIFRITHDELAAAAE